MNFTLEVYILSDYLIEGEWSGSEVRGRYGVLYWTDGLWDFNYYSMEGFMSISFILINTLSMLYYWYYPDRSINLIWEGKRWIFFE